MRALVLALSLLLPLAAADHLRPCSRDADSELTVGLVGNVLYVDVDGTVWVYEESNGVPGLQRGAETADECHGGPEPDTVVL